MNVQLPLPASHGGSREREWYSHHPCLGADAPTRQLVANHSALGNFLGNEGHAAGRGDGHGA